MRVDLRNRDLLGPEPQFQHFEVEVIFQRITIQPILPDIDPPISKDPRLVGPEAIGDVCAPNPRE